MPSTRANATAVDGPESRALRRRAGVRRWARPAARSFRSASLSAAVVLFITALRNGSTSLVAEKQGEAWQGGGGFGVQVPKMVTFSSDSRREGFSWVTRNTRRGEGLVCGGYAKPAS
ncbi:hypothetical protein OG413_38410 [Streptomyces sp. NBC_01433]|uniref:hypothetical protein n=1 Tax=Streptomyces sp. NBC_01433 TaxID=2903864 RepID=UPI0022539191|nr:hypothetical protein [Streptomyces sp. NBC_01433]MCX4681083.1 hypothetical protein [Streptomyces sp. NBC_01433]